MRKPYVALKFRIATHTTDSYVSLCVVFLFSIMICGDSLKQMKAQGLAGSNFHTGQSSTNEIKTYKISMLEIALKKCR